MKSYIALDSVFLFAFFAKAKFNPSVHFPAFKKKKHLHRTVQCSRQIQMIVANREQYPSADKSEPNELAKEVFS